MVVISSRVESSRLESSRVTKLLSRVNSQAFQVESQVMSQVYILQSEAFLPKVNVKKYHID